MTYDHQAIEKKWQEEWEKSGLYKTDTEVPGKDNYYLLTEFPYPSGNLHIGHWYAFAVPDIFARYRRMRGSNVLYPIGFDAFGLPAENAAIKRGLDPRKWTEENIAYMRGQLKSMGNSFDWSREVVTAHPDFYRWTQWLFVQLYKNGLVEKKRASVNWCDQCKTVLANEQVVGGACERCGALVILRELEQWFFKITRYADRLLHDLDGLDWPEEIKQAQRNWIGRSEGATIQFSIFNFQFSNKTSAEGGPTSGGQVPNESIGDVEVFTTRPDTLFGATYLVLAPEHPFIENCLPDGKAGKLKIENWTEVEAYIEQVKSKTEIERMSEGKDKTGVELKGIKAINPANKEEIPIWIADYVLAHVGTGAIMAVPAHDERDFAFAQKFGLPMTMVVCPNYPEPICPVLDHAYTGEGHMVGSGTFDGMPSEQAKREIAKFVGGKMTTTYRLRDWLISRQRYWGTPIPIVYDPEGKPHTVPEEHLPWKLPDDVTDFAPKGTSPIGMSKEMVERTEGLFGKGWRPEVDTMDTFVDSSWYFLRYLDPENGQGLASRTRQEKWMPVDRYSGGAEHTTMHLLYSRFFYKAMTDLGLTATRASVNIPKGEPYVARVNRGLILGPDGRKMSKSKGNVIDPDEFVSRVGADVVKMYLAFVGPYNEPGQYPWDMGGIAGIRRFLERVWRLREKASDAADARDRETEALFQRTIKKVGEDIEQFKFNTAISALMVLTNRLERADSIGRRDYARLLTLLAPFAPYLTEELWHDLALGGSVHTQEWPPYDERAAGSAEAIIVVQVDGRVRGQFAASPPVTEEAAIEEARGVPGVLERLGHGKPGRVVYVENRLVNFVTDDS